MLIGNEFILWSSTPLNFSTMCMYYVNKNVIFMFAMLPYCTFSFANAMSDIILPPESHWKISGKHLSPIFLVTLLSNCSFSCDHLTTSPQTTSPSVLSQLWPWVKKAGRRTQDNPFYFSFYWDTRPQATVSALCSRTSQWTFLGLTDPLRQPKLMSSHESPKQAFFFLSLGEVWTYGFL